MDNETITSDKTYKKCKMLVKIWEKEFKCKHKRIPSKLDIKEASTKVRYAYKKYFQLKSAALENSLDLDFSENDESMLDSPENSFTFEALMECHSPKNDSLSERFPDGAKLNQLLSSQPQMEKKNIINTPKNPFKESLSKKLFQNSKFSLRNPRKSLNSKCSSENITIENESCNASNENIIEMTTCLLSDSFSRSNLNIDNKFQTNSCSPIEYTSTMRATSTLRHYNEGWLERVSGVTIVDKPNTQPNTFGIKNIGIIPIKHKENNTDYVENSESENDDLSEKFKPALKKRKISYEVLEENKYKQKENTGEATPLQMTKSKSRKVNKANKITNIDEEKPPSIDEFTSLSVEKDLLPRYSVNLSTPLVQNKIKRNFVDSENRLELKMKSGTINENFVRINVEKKIFVRGKKSLNYSKYKKKQNKNLKALNNTMEFPESGKILCFKCGEAGHMSRYCTAHRGDELLPLTESNIDEIPTLKEMDIKHKKSDFDDDNQHENVPTFQASLIPESFLKLLADNEPDNSEIQPLYSHVDNVDEKVLSNTLEMFGHNSYRSGQKEAIKRILCGHSTLLVLSTGGGKSLCYQMPAYIYRKNYKCITLVISPLVSLMEDQVLSMPEFLKAGCLHTNQPPTQRNKIIQLLKEGELSILLISPEALVSGEGSNGFGGLYKTLPPIAFVCIDEAHCVSQWSHNFRPSYLMICRILREKLKVKTILGLTATASQTTIKSVISHINIPDGISGVISNPELPSNLLLSVSQENDKDRSLVTFLNSEPICTYDSIIVYCIRRDECERIAGVLRSSLQEPGQTGMEKRGKKRKIMSFVAEAYHAGMSSAQRRKIQNHFMDGSLRIIVATVAFGMGINKSDIRCIIHYDMPSSFESYVQEVGRAGRDGKEARCHVFVNNKRKDKNELLKHIYSNSIDRTIIRKLLQKVFLKCNCKQKLISENIENKQIKCKGHEVAIPIDETVEELDLQAENIITLLCYLELHPNQIIKVLNNTYTMCKIASYSNLDSLMQIGNDCPPLQMAIQLKKQNNLMSNTKNCNIFEFPVVDVAAEIGWESGIAKYKLKNLEWIVDKAGTYKKSSFKVEFHTLGFRIRAPGDLTPIELDKMLDYLHETVMSQEKAKLHQLEEITVALQNLESTAIISLIKMPEKHLVQKSNELKNIIQTYFQRENVTNVEVGIEARPLDEEQVVCDVRALISSYRDCTFTGRSIARIFQGIPSPNFPALVWGRCKFWRSHMNEDFYGLVKIATEQILEIKFK